MIIDSHAHYCHKLYTGEFPYLTREGECFCLARGDLPQLLQRMKDSGIALCIEPATSLENIENQLALRAAHGPYFQLAFGVHPKKCAQITWEDRERLRSYVQENAPIAIGETGLDYSLDPQELDKSCQMQWFEYQIRLAHEHQLPLILHIRDAHADALALLEQHRALLHGGVAHCFGGDYETAMAYIDLGFALGIGGRLLHDDGDALLLQDGVKRVPLSALLVETDAPYIKPNLQTLPESGKQRKKARNTSLILPAVLDKIAALRGEDRAAVEAAIYQNTLRVFRLN